MNNRRNMQNRTFNKPKNRKLTLKKLGSYLYHFKGWFIVTIILTIFSNLFSLVGPLISGYAIGVIEKGKGIEINTSGLRQKFGDTFPSFEYIKLYRELGGEIITIGSDAHSMNYLGYKFKIIPDYLMDAGFDYYTIFKQRKPEFIRL